MPSRLTRMARFYTDEARRLRLIGRETMARRHLEWARVYLREALRDLEMTKLQRKREKLNAATS